MRLAGTAIACMSALALSPGACGQTDGWTPVIGGMPYDSGITLGVEYRQSRLLRGAADFLVRALGSPKKYEDLETALAFPRILDGLLFVELSARYRNYPEEDFWGLGPKSPRHLRSTFRLEDLNYTSVLGVKPWRFARAGIAAGMLRANTGPGQDQDRPSIEQVFTPAEVPGLERQPHFDHLGAFLVVDSRDVPADPRRGGYYGVRWTRYHARKFGAFHFRRWELEGRQFLPAPQPAATIAFRATAILSDVDAGRHVPFFLQPTVGGGNTLRGYHQYRFRDENALILNAEYRWRMREFFQVVGFADGGRVFARPGEIGLAGMRGSVGAGGRLKFGPRFSLGLDMGWSPDGVRFWVRGSDTF